MPAGTAGAAALALGVHMQHILWNSPSSEGPSPDCVVGISRELTDRSPGYLQYSSSQCHPFVEDSTLAGSWTVSVGVGPIQLRESGNSAIGCSEPEPGQVTVPLMAARRVVAPQQAGQTAS